MRSRKFIPDAVTALFATPWLDKTGNTDAIAELHATPEGVMSCYVIDANNSAEDITTFTFDEAKALLEAGAFGDGAVMNDKQIIINEHASHSLQEFLGTVTIAWNQHKARIAKYAQTPPKRIPFAVVGEDVIMSKVTVPCKEDSRKACRCQSERKIKLDTRQTGSYGAFLCASIARRTAANGVALKMGSHIRSREAKWF